MQEFNPPSQKSDARKITLVGVSGHCDFLIRPEDLQWNEPSRLSVQNTLGGAWVDAFGPGIATINISGHTGWRTGAQWEAEFQNLHAVAFKGWHDYVESTKDPESAELFFVDTLDSRCVQVVPQSFTLKRNKNRPLLMQYSISFMVIRDVSQSGPASGGGLQPTPSGSPAADAAKSPLQKFNAALKSIKTIAAKVSSGINIAKSIMKGDMGSLTSVLGSVFGSDVAEAVGGLTGLANDAMTVAGQLGLRDGSTELSTVVGPGATTAGAAPYGASSGQAATAAGGIPADVSVAAAAITGASGAALSHLVVAGAGSMTAPQSDLLSRLISLLREAMRLFTLDVPAATSAAVDMGSLLASLDPDTNPFETLSPSNVPYFSQTSDAAKATMALLRSDCVLNPLTPAQVAGLARRIVAGTTINAVG